MMSKVSFVKVSGLLFGWSGNDGREDAISAPCHVVAAVARAPFGLVQRSLHQDLIAIQGGLEERVSAAEQASAELQEIWVFGKSLRIKQFFFPSLG